MKSFKKLLEPGRIGTLPVKNRILKTGSTPGFFPYADGHMPQGAIDYYEALAAGGVGLVTVAASPLGGPPGAGYRLDDDVYLPGLRRLAGAIRRHDCLAFLQVFHLGPMLPNVSEKVRPVAASSLSKSELPQPGFALPDELTVAEIEEIVAQFADQAERVCKAGFQGVELNAGCVHLLNTFLSPAWNRRRDAYGGSPENRARMVVEIIREVKRRNGGDFAVIALINGAELGLDGGITIAESRQTARLLQEAGADAIHVRGEFYNKPKEPARRGSTHFPDIAFYPEIPYAAGDGVDASRHGPGAWVPLAAAVKKVVSVPVIAVGRLSPELGEKVLRRGQADFISLNRCLMADHDLPNKVAAGRLEDIAPCTACLTCFDATAHGQPPRCRVNAAFGREKEYEIKAAAKRKTVLVAGGGPAGMEAARVAALRGHCVALYERESRLGGAMPLAAVVKGVEREDIPALVKYLKTQLVKLGVDIRLGKELNRAIIEESKPDVLIIATGGVHDVPELPGIDQPNVITGRALHRRLKNYLRFFGPGALHSLTRLWMPLGKKVVVMGGGIHGCQTAELLVKRGRQVTIVEAGGEIGQGLPETFIKTRLLLWLEEKGVTMMTGVKYDEITDTGLVVTTKDGRQQTIAADTIVTALPMLPNRELSESVNGMVPEIYTIGDGEEPRLIVDAIADGSRVARRI